METLICAHCKKELTVDNFSPRKNCKRGYKSWCRTCRKEEHKQYREKYKEELLEKEKRYREQNREKIRENHKKFTEANRKRINEWHRKHYRENIEREKEKYRQYRMKYPDKIKAAQKKFKEKDIDKFHEKYNVYAQIRRARIRELPSNYTNEQWVETKQYFSNTCCYCGEEKELTQDHFIPLSRGGGYTKENIVPACGICNSRKLDSLFENWYPKQDDIYSKSREEKIIKYLNQQKASAK